MAKAGAKGIRAGRAFVEIFADDSKLARGLRAAQNRLRAFGASVGRMGQTLAKAGAAIMAPLLGSAKVFADFESQMKMVSTMLDAPQKHMQRFIHGIRKLAVEFGEDTGVLAKGLYDLLSASVDPAVALDVLAVAAKAAKGGVTDTAVAVDGLTSVLNAFGKAASEAVNVSDVMFATVKRGKLTFPDLASNIGKVAPMARAAGMSMEDMMASIATMTRQGLSAEEATTRLVNILKAAPTEAGNLADLVQRYVGKDLAEIQADFPEISAAGGIAALSADMAGFRKDLDLMKNAGGKAQEAFELMSGGLAGSFKKAKAALTDVMISIGAAIEQPLKQVGDWIKTVLGGIRRWIDANGELFRSILIFIAAMTGIGVGLIVFGAVIKSIAFGIGGLLLLFKGFHLILSIVFGVLAALFSPLGMIVAAVASMAVVFGMASGKIGEVITWLGGRFGELSNFAGETFGAIAKALAAGEITLAADVLWAALKVAWNTGVHALYSVWITFKTWSLKTIAAIRTGVLASWELTVNAMTKAWISGISSLKNAWAVFSQWYAREQVLSAKDWAEDWLWIKNKVGAISDEDYQIGIESIRTSTQSDLDAITSSSSAEATKSAAELKAAMQAADAEHQRRMAEIAAAETASENQIDSEAQAAIAQSADELTKATAAWQAAITATKNLPTMGSSNAPETSFDAMMKKYQAQMDDVALNYTASKAVSGTFNAAAIQSLAGGGTTAAERTAKATEATQKGVAESNKKLARLNEEILVVYR